MNKTTIAAVAGLLVLAGILLFFALSDENGNNASPVPVQENSNSISEEDGSDRERIDDPTESEYVSYTNREHGFSIMRPEVAEVSEESGRIKFMVLGPDAQPNTEITDGFTLTVYRDPDVAESLSLFEYAEESVAEVEANGSTIISSPEIRNINGMSAYRYSFRNLLGGTTWEYVFLPESGRGYRVTYSVIDPEDRGYQEMVFEMLERLEFTA